MLSTEQRVIPGSDYYVYTPSTQAKSLFLYPLIMGKFGYNPGYSLRRNAYDSFLIMLVKKGECEIETGSKIYHAGPGQVVVLNCYEPHAYWSLKGWEAEWLHFDGCCAAGYYHAILDGGPPVITLRDTYRLEKYLHKMYLQFRDCISTREALLNNYIVNILTELLVNKDPDGMEAISSTIIEDTIAYINEHLKDPLTLKELADHALLSPYYFCRLFKKESGFTPHEYVIAARINHAKFLLRSSHISIKDICYSTGFTSESSFCTTFKKVTESTPSQYRFSIQM